MTLLDALPGDTLAQALTDPDPVVRCEAAAALAASPEIAIGGDGIRVLRRVADGGPDAGARQAARDVLGALTERAAQRYASGRQPQARLQAVLVLVALQAIPQLAAAGDDPAREVRVAVAAGLAKAASRPHFATAGIAALGRLLGDRDPLVRLAALHAAQDVGVPAPLADYWRRRSLLALLRRRSPGGSLLLAKCDPPVASRPRLAALALIRGIARTVRSPRQVRGPRGVFK